MLCSFTMGFSLCAECPSAKTQNSISPIQFPSTGPRKNNRLSHLAPPHPKLIFFFYFNSFLSKILKIALLPPTKFSWSDPFYHRVTSGMTGDQTITQAGLGQRLWRDWIVPIYLAWPSGHNGALAPPFLSSPSSSSRRVLVLSLLRDPPLYCCGLDSRGNILKFDGLHPWRKLPHFS